MKLGEALSLRARQAQQMKDLRDRIVNNAQTEKDQAPVEDIAQLIEQYERLSDEHTRTVVNIQRTNAATDVDGVTLLDLLQQREYMIRRRNIYQIAADAATPKRQDRYGFGGGEKTYLPAVNVTGYRRLVEEENERVRVIDAQIQQVNWRTDLL